MTAVKRTAKWILVAIGPAAVLMVILALSGRLGSWTSSQPQGVAQNPTSFGINGVRFSDLQSQEQGGEGSKIRAAVNRRVPLPPFTFTAIEMVGRDLVAAGKGVVVAVDADSFDATTAKYLVPRDAEHAPGSLQAPRRLQADGSERVWVFDFFGLVTLYSTLKTGPPLRTINAGDGNFGAARVGDHFIVHKPGSNLALSVLALDGRKSFGATLVDGPCCNSLVVESTKVVRDIGPPPFGRVNRGMASWLGRAALTSAEGRGVALAFLLDSRVQIYGEDGTLKRSVAAPTTYPLSFDTRRSDETATRIDFKPNSETRFAYTSASANAEGIYLLFAGTPFGEAGAARALLGSEIHRYSWDGDFLSAYSLSESVSQIAVSTDSRRVFGVAGTNLLEFMLPE